MFIEMPRGLLIKGAVFIHDNTQVPYTVNMIKTVLQDFDWDVFDQTPYNPNVPSECIL